MKKILYSVKNMITVHKDSKPRMVKEKSQKNEYKNPREFQNGKILVLICKKIYQDWAKSKKMEKML